jgi:hypothetical protein
MVSGTLLAVVFVPLFFVLVHKLFARRGASRAATATEQI